jgi:hypothetical protein
MQDKYIYFLIFFIPGVLLIIGSIKQTSANDQDEIININKLRYFLAGILALLGALFTLVYG